MYKTLLAAGAAALAMTPALAGNGNGGGNGGGHGGGGDGGGGEMRAMDGGKGGGHGNGGKHGGGDMRAMKSEGHGGGFKAERHGFKAERHADKQFKHQARDYRQAERNVVRNRGFDEVRDRRVAYNGLSDGCPSGLAKKNNGCLPPGQAKKLVGALLPAAYAHSVLSGPYANWYRDDDRYLYRQSGAVCARGKRAEIDHDRRHGAGTDH